MVAGFFFLLLFRVFRGEVIEFVVDDLFEAAIKTCSFHFFSRHSLMLKWKGQNRDLWQDL